MLGRKCWVVLSFCFISVNCLHKDNNGNISDALRIVGSSAVEVTDLTPYPYIVGVIKLTSVSQLGQGSGVIIGKWWVLTSGTVGLPIKNYISSPTAGIEYYVRSDKVDISVLGTSYRRRITAATVYPGYTNAKRDKNLAVLKVCPYFQDGRAATLGPSSPVAASQTGTVLGWGGTNLRKLKSLVETVDSDANCATKSAAVTAGRVYDAVQNFCVLSDGTNSLCSTADSGSPFIMGGKIVGILDEMSANCPTGGADTFTELDATFIAWINAQKV